MEPHDRLEQRLATFHGTETALLFGSGYLANTGVIAALARRGEVVFSDELNHASIIDGCRLAGARTFVYRHRDLEHLAWGLGAGTGARRADRHRRPLLDGRRRRPARLAARARQSSRGEADGRRRACRRRPRPRRARLRRRGRARRRGRRPRRHARQVAGQLRRLRVRLPRGSRPARQHRPPADLLDRACRPPSSPRRRPRWRSSSRSRRGSTGCGRTPRRCEPALAANGLEAGGAGAQILPVAIGDPDRAVAICRRALEAGVYAQAIRPPTVPSGTSRLRLTVLADHRPDQLVDAAGSSPPRSGPSPPPVTGRSTSPTPSPASCASNTTAGGSSRHPATGPKGLLGRATALRRGPSPRRHSGGKPCARWRQREAGSRGLRHRHRHRGRQERHRRRDRQHSAPGGRSRVAVYKPAVSGLDEAR